MKFEKLSQILFDEIKQKIESHKGLTFFAKERAKFEGWLKVEICNILSNYSQDIGPEYHRVDIKFEDWGIELKTINTNIRYEEHGVKSKTRPITKNTEGVIKDINKLNNLEFNNKAVLFIVFPIEHDNPKWQIQLKRITAHLKDHKACQFNFCDSSIKGMIYMGLV